jgi:hypothetical protein
MAVKLHNQTLQFSVSGSQWSMYRVPGTLASLIAPPCNSYHSRDLTVKGTFGHTFTSTFTIVGGLEFECKSNFRIAHLEVGGWDPAVPS